MLHGFRHSFPDEGSITETREFMIQSRGDIYNFHTRHFAGLSLSTAPSALVLKLQPADKMLSHANEKPTFLTSNHCYVTHLLRMTTTHVVETSVTVNNSPIQEL